MSIFDIPQPRDLVRCKQTEIVVTPANIFPPNFSVSDNLAEYYAFTNHRFNHTARIDVRVKCDDAATKIPAAGPTLMFGFALLGKTCQLPNLAGGDIFYGITNITRAGAGDFTFAGRFGSQTTTSRVNNGTITDASFVTGVVFSVIVGNRFVQFLLEGVPFSGAPYNGNNYTQGPYSETSSGYVTNPAGSLPPLGSKFRWTGGRTVAFEQLVPALVLKIDTNMDLLAVAQGEDPTTQVPPQP